VLDRRYTFALGVADYAMLKRPTSMKQVGRLVGGFSSEVDAAALSIYQFGAEGACKRTTRARISPWLYSAAWTHDPWWQNGIVASQSDNGRGLDT